MSTPMFPEFVVPSSVDPVSVDHWRHISETVEVRERRVMRAVFDYLAQTKRDDVTGGELAEFLQLDKTLVRPRLTGLQDKSLLERGPIRQSHIDGEGRCRPYRPTITKEAYERGGVA